MVETVIQWDRQLFKWVNQSLYSDAMDVLMHYLSERLIWLPLYLALIIYLFYVFRAKAWWVLLALAMLVTSTDMVSSHVIKKSVQRYRPCQEKASLGFVVHQYPGDGCSEYGFVSSHASNSFGLAVFFGLLFYDKNKWWLWGSLLWASLIGFSRIYLGVHYPLDVIGGALLGAGFGYIWWRFLGVKLKNIEA